MTRRGHRQRDRQRGRGPWRGTIASGPDDTGAVTALIPALDDGAQRHGPCLGWAPRPDDVEPARGDPCLVVEDDQGGLWIAAWTPAT